MDGLSVSLNPRPIRPRARSPEERPHEEDPACFRGDRDHRRRHLVRAKPGRRPLPRLRLGLGILGGVVAGTIIGSAIASHPGYYTYDEYDAEPPYGCPAGGYWARRPAATTPMAEAVRWSRADLFLPLSFA